MPTNYQFLSTIPHLQNCFPVYWKCDESSLDLMNAKTVRILALDYGRARIGLAIGNTEAGLAQPLGRWIASIATRTCGACGNWCASMACSRLS